MHDTEASDLDRPNGVALAEFLAPRVSMFPGISDHRDVANLVGAGLAQDESIRRPRHRPAHRFTAVVVVMWVGDQDSVGPEVRREIVSQPNAAGVWIDEHLLARRGGCAETSMGNVLEGYCAVLPRRVLSANVAGGQGKDHECCQQKGLRCFGGVSHGEGRSVNEKVRDASQPAPTNELQVSQSAGSRPLRALVSRFSTHFMA